MIDRFQVGKWYIYRGIKHYNGLGRWHDSEMDFALKRTPLLCSRVNEYPHHADFTGFERDGELPWSWREGFEDWYEVFKAEDGLFYDENGKPLKRLVPMPSKPEVEEDEDEDDGFFDDFDEEKEVKVDCESLGWKVGDIFELLEDSNSMTKGDIFELIDDDGTDMPNYKLLESTTGRYPFGKTVYLKNMDLKKVQIPKHKNPVDAYIVKFDSANNRDWYWEFLKSHGYELAIGQTLHTKGNWGVCVPLLKTYVSFNTETNAKAYVNHKGYKEIRSNSDNINQQIGIHTVTKSESSDKQLEKIEQTIKEEGTTMATKQLKLEKTKQLQIDAAKIAAKIEIGKVANTQITKRIMKQIDLPPFLVGYKKQIEPVIRLLVANGALIAADSMGVDNKKAEFILEAMQLAGTQEVLGLINLDETIDNLIGMIDPKMMARAGADDVEVESED